jgi:DNA-binding transcriptional regulator YiaG
MTNTEFKSARNTLGLTLSALGHILDTNPRTIRRWEAGDRDVNPIAARAMSWMLDGYRPPEWPKDITPAQ